MQRGSGEGCITATDATSCPEACLKDLIATHDCHSRGEVTLSGGRSNDVSDDRTYLNRRGTRRVPLSSVSHRLVCFQSLKGGHHERPDVLGFTGSYKEISAIWTNLDSILKSRDITLPIKVIYSKLWFFQESCTDVKVGPYRWLGIEKLMLSNCGVGEDS